MAYCLLLLLASFSSKSYEQQYGIGDTGPNGGVVTSVTVESILTNTTVELVGDFEETTYTYTHTETIIEEVETTEYIEQTSYEIVSTETTSNLITSSIKTTSGVVLDHTDHFHTDYQGGSITYTEDITNYLDVTEINEGFDLYGQANVSTCTNQIGGHCSSGLTDTFSITLKVIDPKTGEDYMKTTTWSVGNAWQTYQTSLNVPSNTLGADTLALATFYGMDNGYWSGWYGPVINNMQMWAVYSQVQEVINIVENIVTEQIQSVITSETYEVDSVYIPPVFNPVDATPVETEIMADFSIEIADDLGEVITLDFEISETDSGEMQMEITTMEGDVEMEVEVVELEVESEQEKEESSNSESDSKEKKEDSKSTKEQIAQKIMERVASTGDQVALNNVKLAVMAQLTDTKAFEAYTTKYIVDNNVDQYLLQTIEDPYGILFSNAQDQLMNQMVESQYGGN